MIDVAKDTSERILSLLKNYCYYGHQITSNSECILTWMVLWG